MKVKKKPLTKIGFYSHTYITHFHFSVTGSPLLVNYYGHPFGKTDPSFSHNYIVSTALTHTMDFIAPLLMDSQKASSPLPLKIVLLFLQDNAIKWNCSVKGYACFNRNRYSKTALPKG